MPGRGGSSHSDSRWDTGTFTARFGSVSRIPAHVTMRVFEDNPAAEGASQESTVEMKVSPTPEHPLELSQGKAGKLLITQVDRQADRTLVRYRVEGQMPQEQAYSLWIVGPAGEKVLQLKKPAETVDADKYEFVREFPRAADGPITFGTKQLQPPSYLQNFEVRIDVK